MLSLYRKSEHVPVDFCDWTQRHYEALEFIQSEMPTQYSHVKRFNRSF